MTETFEVDHTDNDQVKPSEMLSELPSQTLWIFGLPDDDDDGELEMRLARFGELNKLDREGEKAIATFRHTRTAIEAKDKLDGFTLGSGRSIDVQFAPVVANPLAQIDAITGEVIRTNRELHFKIGQLVRSTYSAMRSITGNYPPPKQNLIPDDFRYIDSTDAELELQSKWSPDMQFEEMMRDYEEYADRRPFHNRYAVIFGSESTNWDEAKETVSHYVRSVIGDSNLIDITIVPGGFHLAMKSTRDASMVCSAINSSLSTGEGGLVGKVDVSSVKFAPPINTASSGGNLWFGCSAFLAVDEYRLRAMLELFGQIDHMRLVASKNCLFVNFRNEADGIRCRNKLFSYEIAPGHFLNTDFAPPAQDTLKRRMHASEPTGYNKRYYQSYSSGPVSRTESVGAPETLRIELSKMGERMCTVLGRKFVIQNGPNIDSFLIPSEIDICNRTKVDYAKNNLDKLGYSEASIVPGGVPKDSGSGAIVLWHFSAASERDCRGYDELCDYFVSKERVGFYADKEKNLVTYFIPPVKQFLEPLGLPSDSRYLMALQMPPMTVAGQQ